jgi:hypothetical protein
MRRGSRPCRWLFNRDGRRHAGGEPLFRAPGEPPPRIVFITATYVFFALSLLGF